MSWQIKRSGVCAAGRCQLSRPARATLSACAQLPVDTIHQLERRGASGLGVSIVYILGGWLLVEIICHISVLGGQRGEHGRPASSMNFSIYSKDFFFLYGFVSFLVTSFYL